MPRGIGNGQTRPGVRQAACTNPCAEKRKATRRWLFFSSGGARRSRTGLDGFAGRCITALLSRQKRIVDTLRTRCVHHDRTDWCYGLMACQTKGEALLPRMSGAGDESRTRDLNLGKVALYQLSYSRVCCCLATAYCFFTPSGASLKSACTGEVRLCIRCRIVSRPHAHLFSAAMEPRTHRLPRSRICGHASFM